MRFKMSKIKSYTLLPLYNDQPNAYVDKTENYYRQAATQPQFAVQLSSFGWNGMEWMAAQTGE